MIIRCNAVLESSAALTPSDAYILYAAMLEKMSPEISARLHSEDSSLYSSQYILPLQGRAGAMWNVTFAGDGAERASAEFEAITKLETKEHTVSVNIIKKSTIRSLEDMLTLHGADQNRFVMQCLTPTAFRSDNEYQIFPSVELIIKSLMRKWDTVFPFSPMNDEDAARMIISSTKITGYRLRSASFRLKGFSVPSFVGSVTLSARLASPMLKVLQALLSFANFSGVGIKTKLGMGGVEVKNSPKITASDADIHLAQMSKML